MVWAKETKIHWLLAFLIIYNPMQVAVKRDKPQYRPAHNT